MAEVVILTGFMGSGKTATGRELAGLLGWEFVDLDDEVERVAGKSVAQIFQDDGEARFRDLEAEALARVVGRQGAVVATGGGVLLREENRRRLSGLRVVNLRVSPAECVRRVRGSSTERPLLRVADPEGQARALWAAREHLYASVACQVETEGKTPADVAREIRERFLAGDAP